MFSLSNLTGGIVLVALVAGGATAGKAALTPSAQSAAQEAPPEEILPSPEVSDVAETPVETPTPTSTPTPEATESSVEEAEPVSESTEVVSSDSDVRETEQPENHGAAVSTAAHCPLKGRSHGELVSSIAKNKEATVADAQAACEEAINL